MHPELIKLEGKSSEHISDVVTDWDDTTAREVARDIIRRYKAASRAI